MAARNQATIKKAYKLIVSGDSILKQVCKPVTYPVSLPVTDAIDDCINTLVSCFPFHLTPCFRETWKAFGQRSRYH